MKWRNSQNSKDFLLSRQDVIESNYYDSYSYYCAGNTFLYSLQGQWSSWKVGVIVMWWVQSAFCPLIHIGLIMGSSDAGRWKNLGGPVVMGEHNLPSPWNRVNWSAKYWGARVTLAPPIPAWPVAPRFRHHWNRLHYANGSFFIIQLPLFFFKWNAFSVLFLFYSTGKFSNRLTQNLFNFWLFTVNPVHFMLPQCSRSLYEFAL